LSRLFSLRASAMRGINCAEYVPPSSEMSCSDSKLSRLPRQRAMLPFRPEVSTETINIRIPRLAHNLGSGLPPRSKRKSLSPYFRHLGERLPPVRAARLRNSKDGRTHRGAHQHRS